MGLVSDISALVKSTAEALTDVVYFRLSDVQKVEFELSRVALAGKTAIIYSNLPDIPITQNPVTITESYPIQIWFVQLMDEADEVDVDGIIDTTHDKCLDFYNDFRQTQKIGTSGFNLELTDGIQINSSAAFRLGNESFAGVEFLINLSIEKYLCLPKFSLFYDFTLSDGGWASTGLVDPVNYIAGQGWEWPDPTTGGRISILNTVPINRLMKVTTVWKTVNGLARNFLLEENGTSPFLLFPVSADQTLDGEFTFVSASSDITITSSSLIDRDIILESILIEEV